MLGLLVTALSLPACGDDSSSNSGGTDGGTESESDTNPTSPDTENGTEGGTDTGPDTEGGTDTEDTTDTGPLPEDFEPAPGGMRRLVTREYRDSVRVMLGDAAADAAIPPDDIAQDGFDAVGASIVAVPVDAIEVYERSSAAVADAVVENPQTLAATVPCVAQGENPACYAEIATNLGRFAFRRSLTPDEIDTIAQIGAAGREWGDGDFMAGVRYEVMAILQAPSFLYIQEVGDEDANSGFRRLKPTELATRMSFFLTGHTPSLELLDMAEGGELDSVEQIRAQAQAMVASNEARPALAAFFSEALRLRELSEAPKNAEIFPEFSPELGDLMRDETLLLLHDIIWERDADYRELFNANYTYVNDALADLYGMPDPGTGPLFARMDWPADQNRAGYTSQASFLTWQSGPRRNSPTKRGKYVQEMILCIDIPPPDPGVDPTLPESDDLTLKELLEMHMTEPGCASCHAQTDPIGFAFESYTAIGGHRILDNGKPVETDGAIPGIGEWENAREFGEVLANDPRVSKCLIENFIRGTLGHSPTEGEEPGIEELDATFADSGHRVQTLLVDMAAHPIFRLVNEPK